MKKVLTVPIHPKAGGAALGAAVGALVVAILRTAGVEMDPELPAAITGVLAAVIAYIAPN